MHTSFPMRLYSLIFTFTNWHLNLRLLWKLEAMFLLTRGKSTGPWTSLLLIYSLLFFLFWLVITGHSMGESKVRHYPLQSAWARPSHSEGRRNIAFRTGEKAMFLVHFCISTHVIFMAMEKQHWVEACS